ncbi:hypothetical protein FQN54_006739 [Arachnomyces sp. PD_36]|nr:hypothetical protein FQN54_006739 [Arachnomyces sp. PD_36]
MNSLTGRVDGTVRPWSATPSRLLLPDPHANCVRSPTGFANEVDPLYNYKMLISTRGWWLCTGYKVLSPKSAVMSLSITLSHGRLLPTLLRVFGFCAILGVISSAPATAALPAADPGNSSEQTLAQNGDDGPTPYYRIVALANLGDGVVLASFDGRPDGSDSPSPNSILQRRSTDNGATWGEVTYIAKGQPGGDGVQKYGFSDPSYIVDRETGIVFNFHVFSKNQGFAGSVIGNDDKDLDVQSAEVSVSHDKGLTWSTDPENQPNLPPVASGEPGEPPLITRAVKPVGTTQNGVDNVGGVVGTFASSGEGIQLRYGEHAGRLIQQYAGTIIQADGSTEFQAYSAYSDDGGVTWNMGTPVGTGMDENKVVELSDGRVMLNSRDSGSTGYRKVAISTDGGVTYSEPKEEPQLPDPRNNAGITRMYPDAAEGSADAKVLLFSNANSKTDRVNGTIRYSCDEGKSWSSGRVFQSGDMSYSTLTALDDGLIGLFYEGPDGKLILATLDKAWIGVDC